MGEETVSKNFIEQIIEKDLAEGKYDTICTRFPPETAPSILICTRFLKLLLSAVVFTAFVPELFIRPSLLFEFNSQEDLRLIRCHHFEIKSPESVLQVQGFDIPSYVLLSSRL